MAEAKALHKEWQDFKAGPAAEMIKLAKLNFNGGLGPQLDTLDAKWGKPDGAKSAEKIKGLVTNYLKILESAKTAKIAIKPTTGLARPERPAGEQFKLQRDKGAVILNKIKHLAEGHKLEAAAKK